MFWFEVIMFIMVIIVVFIVIILVFCIVGYEVEFNWVDKNKEKSVMVYEMFVFVGLY